MQAVGLFDQREPVHSHHRLVSLERGEGEGEGEGGGEREREWIKEAILCVSHHLVTTHSSLY